MVFLFARHVELLSRHETSFNAFSTSPLLTMLFPSSNRNKTEFRKSTYPTEKFSGTTDDDDDAMAIKPSMGPITTPDLYEFLGTHQRESALVSANSARIGHQGRPIAELFLNTSVLFADIEGTLDFLCVCVCVCVLYR